LNSAAERPIVGTMRWSWRSLVALACLALVLCAAVQPDGLTIAVLAPPLLVGLLLASVLAATATAVRPRLTVVRIPSGRAPPRS
jgi:hypothetical protein